MVDIYQIVLTLNEKSTESLCFCKYFFTKEKKMAFKKDILEYREL